MYVRACVLLFHVAHTLAQYVVANKGIDTEASYPYTAKQGKCHYSTANIGATISSYSDVAHTETALLAASGTVGPISVAIDASHQSFQFYTSGVYYEPACSSTQLDHGVLVVGYGMSGSSAYWIVKNSWGPAWGQAGYIWMSRNRNNNCGIATQASYPIAGSSTAASNSGPAASNSGPAASGPAASNSGPAASGASIDSTDLVVISPSFFFLSLALRLPACGSSVS